MKHHPLGRTRLRVSELFLGAMGFGRDQGPSPENIRQIVDLCEDAGGNVIDTANNYSEGRSEQAVAEAIVGRRDRFVLATTYTFSRDINDPNGAGNHRKSLTQSLEQSLRRLNTDHIDLYWVHLWDRYTPIEQTMRALDDEVRAGKILYTGISPANPGTYSVASGSFTLVNPTRSGYTFAGWTGTGLTQPTLSVSVAGGSMGDRAYTATWTLIPAEDPSGSTPSNGSHTPPSPGGLPHTGSDAGVVLPVGLLALLVGAVITIASTRRRNV